MSSFIYNGKCRGQKKKRQGNEIYMVEGEEVLDTEQQINFIPNPHRMTHALQLQKDIFVVNKYGGPSDQRLTELGSNQKSKLR